MKKLLMFCLLIFIIPQVQAQCDPVIHYDECDLEIVDQWKYISFQWYKGTAPIEYEANGFSYTPIEPGLYRCRTYDQNGCVGYSQRYKITNFCGVGVNKLSNQ